LPFVSKAQRRKFYADERLHKYIAEYEAATPKGPLPERVGQKIKLRRRRRRRVLRRKRA
jgi:hypothetical protein